MPRQYLHDYDPSDEVMTGCIVFAGQSVNLHRMAEQSHLDYTYLYRIFKGLRVPSIHYIQKLATALEMTRAQFLDALDVHVQVRHSEAESYFARSDDPTAESENNG